MGHAKVCKLNVFIHKFKIFLERKALLIDLVLLKCSTTGSPTQLPPSAKVHQSKPGKWNLIIVVCPVVFIVLLHCLTEVTFSFFKRG